MTVITVAERGYVGDGSFGVAVQFEGGGEHLAEVADPLANDRDGERLLTWYFEEHLRYPFLDHDKERAAVKLLETYGKALFAQLFEASRNCSYEFRRYRDQGFDGLRLEIVGGADFHRIHWESLRSDEAGTPFGARVPIFRRVEDVASGFDVRSGSSTLNVLVVTARPHGARDVGYRTISRPLLGALRQARIPVKLDLVRPGTWQALRDHLQATTSRHGSGWYGIVHFDVHGAVASIDDVEGGGRTDYLLAEGASDSDEEGAYLFFETSEVGVAEPASTEKVANLLIEHRVPVAVLNACQSAMQSEGSEASLAQCLVESGVPVAVGMAYSVTVSAAQLMMPVIYKQLAEGTEILPAIHAGRRKLFDVRGRRAYFDRKIDLEDWILPVVFSQRPVMLQPQPATPGQLEELYGRKAWHVDEPEPEYGFVGRDLDVQAIERRLLAEGAHNELLVSGMAGAGKSTLLKHLAWWWQATGLVERVLSFSYEDRAWTIDQILRKIIGELLSGSEEALAQALPVDAQLERVADLLSADRHLLILDNAESITATPASIPHSLPEEQRARLGRFLSRLRGGKTLVLIGSRGSEQWLAADSFGSNAYELGGLDPQAASVLQERIIARHGGSLPDSSEERKVLDELVDTLRGSPLALSVALPVVAEDGPSAVLAELRRGGEAVDPEGVIQGAIEFSHGRLDPATQNSLVVLAPFTGVVPRRALGRYCELLMQYEPVSALGELDIESALKQAIGAGLASPDANSSVHIRLQPVFPFFLRTRLTGRPELAAALAKAHQALYEELGPTLHALLRSHEPDERAAGLALMQVEYANLTSALRHALPTGSPLGEFIGPLEEYLDLTHQEYARQQLLERAIDAVGEPSERDRLAELAYLHNLAGVAAVARHHLGDARFHHKSELSIREGLDDRHGAARTYHQLGIVAQVQRRFEEAEGNYRRALEIKLEFDDRHGAAHTYHQLGMVAQEQRRFEDAEGNYRKALEIYEEFKDRLSAAGTYHQLGTVAQKQRLLEEAEGNYRKALEIYKEFDDLYETADVYHQLGMVAQEQGRFEDAEGNYRKALEIKLEFDDRHSAASTYHQLGIVAQRQRRFEEAEGNYRKALETYEEFDDRHSASHTYHQLGIVAQEQRLLEEAEGNYRKALETYEEFDDRHSAASTYHQLGMVAQEEGRFEEAEDNYRRALEIKLEFDDGHGAANTYHQLGVVAQRQRRFEEAEGNYRKAFEIYEEFADRYGAASSRSQLGILLTKMGRTTDAIQCSLDALSARRDLTARWSELDLRWLRRQRTLVGSDRFRVEVVRRQGEEFFNQLTDLLKEVDEPPETESGS